MDIRQADALGKLLALQQHFREGAWAREPLTEREHLDGVLRHATHDAGSHDTDSLLDAFLFFDGGFLGHYPPELRKQRLAECRRESALQDVKNWWNGTASTRAEFREHLELIEGNKAAARKRLSPAIDEIFPGIAHVPKSSWNGLTYRLEIRQIPGNMRTHLMYAVMLLVDVERKFDRSLRFCKACRTAFLSWAPPSGGPLAVCCSEACKAVFKRTDTAERVRKVRAEAKKKRAKKAKRRKS